MRLVLAAALAIATVVPAQAFDLNAFADRMLDCDGPGLKLAHRFASTEVYTSQDEADGYAALDMIEMLVGDDVPTGSLRGFAAGALNKARDGAVARAGALIDECRLTPEQTASPNAVVVPNPLSPNR